MNLPIPTVGIAGGPLWATLLDSCLTILDSHSHVAGSGVPITPSAMNINIDLSMGGNNLTTARSVRFSPNGAALALVTDIGCLYEAGVDLYYNDGAGNQIRITQSGSVTGASGTITGLPSGTASASYVSVSSKFAWQSATNTAADMDMGSAIMRNISPNSTYSLTLSPPAALGANYALTLPALPPSQKFMTLDASGIMSAPWTVDGTSIEVSSNTVRVKVQGITQAMHAIRAQGATVAAGGYAISTGSGTYNTSSATYVDVTNLSVTIDTLGNPVNIILMPDVTEPATALTSTGVWGTSNGGSVQAVVRILRDATVVAVASSLSANMLSGFTVTDFPAAGTYVYKVQMKLMGSGAALMNDMRVAAYET